ncbi:ABC-type phosphate/phosphonate transport system ATPase subunit [Thermocatellispora tengchongensis]|uniref:ABC-type phosphate/phosphonate transport system ATPase subunit n=1 Tax=Thermocatellispora tengchongensis TaxID=1073253 RepID=A0A840PH47_9ACTN|nr:AAA family ATPase [Thermocatellispora tengchongensis]MBB5136457.1 ABC-type phosphate/phosphonate transport system ATPase subunit [Thermocatellispora tengchongensis]
MTGTPATQDLEDLRYPPGSLVLLAGLPGAGKSTLLDRLYRLTGTETEPVRAGDVRVIDSRQSRNWWSRYLRPINPRLRTPIVHTTHVWRIVRELLRGHAVIAHTRGTWPHILYGLSWLARRAGAQAHLILLDVDADTALRGQRDRGRVVAAPAFARHRRRWNRVMAQARSGSLPPAESVVILTRASADRLRAIHFDGP